MKKILSLFIILAITCVCCSHSVKAESEITITTYADLVDFIDNAQYKTPAIATISSSFVMEDTIQIIGEKDITLYIAEDVTISNNETGESMFSVDSSKLKILNSKLKTPDSDIDATKCVFKGVSSPTSGDIEGLFINATGNSELEFKGITVKDFCSKTGSDSSKGVIFTIGSLTVTTKITNCIFKDNKVSLQGAVSVGGICTIDNSIFSGNVTYDSPLNTAPPALGGSAVTAGASCDITIKNTKFINNANKSNPDAPGAGLYCSGGALRLYDVSNALIEKCEFDGNSSNSSGGAIFANVRTGRSDLPELTIKETTFKNNSADEGGTARINGYDVTIMDSNFESNNARRAGGCLYFEYCETEINNSKIKSCSTQADGGAIYLNEGTLDLYKTEIENNIAESSGGAIYFKNQDSNNNSVFTVKTDTIIKNNTTDYLSAIVVEKTKMVIDGTNITISNKNIFGEKEDVTYYGKAFEVKEGATVNEKIAIAVRETYEASNPSIVVDKGQYSGNLKDIFTVAKGNYNLAEVQGGLRLDVYEPTTQPSYTNDFTYEYSELTGTDIVATVQWYSRKINKTEVVKNTTDTYETFDGIELNSAVTYSDGVYTYLGDYGSLSFIKLKGIQKGQRISFDAQGSSTEGGMIAVTDPTFTNLYGYAVVSVNNGSLSEIINEDGDYYVVAMFGANTKVSNLKVSSYGNDVKQGTAGSRMTQAEGEAENFCKIIYTNDNHKVEYMSNSVQFDVPEIGNSQTFETGKKTALDFSLEADDASFTDFENSGKVFIDGFDSTDELTRNDDYTYSKGSIVISINKDLIGGLSEGNHTIYVVENITATTTQKITAVNFTIETPNNQNDNTSTYQIVHTGVGGSNGNTLKLIGLTSLLGVVSIFVTKKKKH